MTRNPATGPFSGHLHSARWLCLIGLSLFLGTLAGCSPPSADVSQSVLAWEQLPSLPTPLGFAGPYVGVSQDALIVAGGANFPADRPIGEGKKVWYDSVFVLPEPRGKWLEGYRLPRPLGYGVSLTWDDRILCIGGSDSERHYSDVFTLSWTGTTITTATLPPLPRPCAMAAGVLFKDRVYIAGGTETPSSSEALKTFWMLDLGKPPRERAWTSLPSWPGPPRILPLMGVQNEQIYLFSGARLLLDGDGNVTREMLTDAYRFDPDAGEWARIGDTPRPIIAAPGPAIPLGSFHLVTLSGDDGENFARQNELGDRHPGFLADILAYNTVTDRWTTFGSFPKRVPRNLGEHGNAGAWPPVTTSITPWRGHYVIATGEARPRVRTPNVFWAEPVLQKASFGWINSAVLALYLVLLVFIGFWFSRRMKTSEDYFLASGRIPWWAAGLSIFSTQLSAITYLALPARSFATDWSQLLYNLGILAIVPLVLAFYLPVYRRLGSASVYEYLEKRFGMGLRLVGVLAFVIYQIGRMGVIILLPALALAAVTGLELYFCLALMGLLSTFYTVMGGIEAVIWTDVLQTLVLLAGGIAAVVIVILGVQGGMIETLREGFTQGKLTVLQTEGGWSGDAWYVLLLAAFFGNLVPYTSDQAVVQRYLTTATEERARRAIWTNALLSIPATILFLSVGTCLFLFYQHHPASLVPLEKTDQIFPLFISRQMPVGLAGLVIAGVFAAAMSSIDSSIHSMATVITTGIQRRIFPDATEARILGIARWLTVFLGVLGTLAAMLLANFPIVYLWDFFLTLIGLVMGGIAGVFALGIFCKRATARDAWIGLLIAVALITYCKLETNINGLLYSVIGLGSTLVVGFLTSLLPGGRAPERPEAP